MYHGEWRKKGLAPVEEREGKTAKLTRGGGGQGTRGEGRGGLLGEGRRVKQRTVE